MKNITFLFLLLSATLFGQQPAILDVHSTTKGIRPMPITSIQRNLWPATNTTSSQIDYYQGTKWFEVADDTLPYASSSGKVNYSFGSRVIQPSVAEWRDTTTWVNDRLAYVDSAKVKAIIWSGFSSVGVEMKVILNFSKTKFRALFFPLEPQGFKWFDSSMGDLSGYAYFLGPFRVKPQYVLHILETKGYRDK